MQHSERVERLWLTRLRWRMRGAWLWPAYFASTLLAGILLDVLPPYDGTPPGLIGCVLLAGAVNLFLIAVAAPLGGRLLRRRRPDLPRPIAADYVGATLVCVVAAVVLVAGIAHRPAIAAEQADRAAVARAVRGYVEAQAGGWQAGVAQADVLRLQEDLYRACVPGPDPERWLCLFAETDRRPAGVRRDHSMEPNSELRTVGGFR